MANEKNTKDYTYAILGDLGGGKYIVRMHNGGYVVDKEFTAEDAQDLHDQINNYMNGLDLKAEGVKIPEWRPEGHALDMSEVE